MAAPRFTLKDLFLATTLILVGAVGLCWTIDQGREIAPMYSSVASGAAMGAGMGALFQRKLVGSLVGVALGGTVGWVISIIQAFHG